MPRRTTLVTVEEITDDDLLADDRMAAGTIPALYVSRDRARRARGAWPVGLRRRLSRRSRASAPLCGAGRDEAGFARYLDEFVLERAAAE